MRAAPGFIVPRLQALIMAEAARMIEDGVAAREDIDRATRYGFGFRFASIGVVEFIDYRRQRHPLPRLPLPGAVARRALRRAPDRRSRYMREGRDGLRTGQGFYDWKAVDVPTYRREALGRQLAMLRQLGILKPPGAAQGD